MLIVVDANGLAHRVKHTLKDLTYAEKKTGVIFGFLNSVYKMAEQHHCMCFAFCWDSGKSYRKQVYPDYKAHRTAKISDDPVLDDLARSQFYMLRTHILPKIGFVNNFIQTGYEADDIIAALVRDVKANQAITDIIVASRDNDLWQLLDDCDIYDLGTKDLFTAKQFTKTYDIPPRDWARVKAIAGCSTDELPGISGIGEDKAIRFLKGTLPHGKSIEKILSPHGHMIIERNLPLVTLPYNGTKVPEIDFTTRLQTRGFQTVCEDYGFNSFLRPDRFNRWRRLFRMVDD